MESVLEDINAEIIKLNDSQTKKFVRHQKWLVETIFRTMKDVDPLFDHLSPSIYWTGSYNETTRVNKANEFDVNFVIELPTDEIEVLLDGVPFSTVRLRIPDYFESHDDSDDLEELSKWLGETGCLKQDEVRYWTESVVQRTISRLEDDEEIDEDSVLMRKSGPAFTLEVTMPNRMQYSLDIVIAVQLEKLNTPIKMPGVRFPPGDWFAVPKPRDSSAPGDTCWRTSFPKQEKSMLEDKQHLLPTFRLMKRFRDKQGWEDLASYHIKTIFLWEVERQKRSFWDNSLSYLFIHMLEVLYDCFIEGCIEYFWDTRCNLLEQFTQQDLHSMRRQLKRCIDDLKWKKDDDPEVLDEYLR